MKKEAVGMLSAAYRIKKIREKDPNPNINEINSYQRFYKKCSD